MLPEPLIRKVLGIGVGTQTFVVRPSSFVSSSTPACLPDPEHGDSRLKNHSLITTLKSLTGNPRGCVYTEPIWGIPFNLYAPYVSIYMIALGLSDIQIGTILSISWGFQIFMALIG